MRTRVDIGDAKSARKPRLLPPDTAHDAIITTSIEQMNAYGELVRNVADNVGDFMQDSGKTGADGKD